VNSTRYRILGFIVWRGGKWYVRRTYGRYLPSRRTIAVAAAAGTVLAGAVALGSRHQRV